MLQVQIKKWFEEAVRLNPECEDELKRKLLRFDHPLIERFFGELRKQIEQGQRLCEQRGLVLRESTMQEAVYDMTAMFVLGIKGRAKLMYESDLAKAAREAEAQQVQEFEDVLSGNPTGEFLEAGVISDEKIDSAREKELEAQDRADRKEV